MFLWTVIFVIVHGSHQDVRLPRAITKFSSNITVSGEVCGYLRHIKTGTCVGPDMEAGNGLLAAKFPCSEQNLFCWNTRTQQIRKGTGSRTSSADKVVTKSGDNLELKSNSDTTCTRENPACKWRLREGEKIQTGKTVDDKYKCWKRVENVSLIEVVECDDNNSIGELERQQFDFQQRNETSGEQPLLSKLNTLTTKPKGGDRLKIFVDGGSVDNKYRFHIKVDFFNGSASGSSSGTLKLRYRYLDGEKNISLSAINWNKNEGCSTEAHRASGQVRLVVWINTAGQLNIVLNKTKVELKCLVGPWSNHVKINVTGINLKWSEKGPDELFDIHYEIEQIIREYCEGNYTF